MNQAERKRAQRKRDRLAGWTEITLRVDAHQVEAVRAYVASLPSPPPPTDPAQLSLIDQLDAMLRRDVSPDGADPAAGQGVFWDKP